MQRAGGKLIICEQQYEVSRQIWGIAEKNKNRHRRNIYNLKITDSNVNRILSKKLKLFDYIKLEKSNVISLRPNWVILMQE